MPKKKYLSLKYLYLLSSMGVAVIACAVVGILLYFSSANELRTTNERQTMGRITLFASDLAAQHKALGEIASILSSQIYYKPAFFERNPYYEIELFKEFVKFKNNSPIIDDYFLLYKDSKWVYKSTNAKNSFEVFVRYYGLNDMDGKLYEQLCNLDAFTVLQNNSSIIFAWPVYTQGKTDEYGRATAGFFISPQKLHNRLSTLAGDIEGEIYLLYDNTCFMSLNTENSLITKIAEYAREYDQTVVRQDDKSVYYIGGSENGQFQVILHTRPDSAFKNLYLLNVVNTLYISVAVLLTLAASVFIGYINYKPIKKLSEKYRIVQTGAEGRNELENVEMLFDNALKEKKDAELNLQKQYKLIKEQILTLLINGESRYIPLVNKSFMGIHLPGPLFYVAAVRPFEQLSEEKVSKISALVEDLPESGMRLYFVSTQFENCYAVIISVLDTDMGEDAVDYVKSLLQELVMCEISVSQPFYSLSKLKSALTFAARNRDDKDDTSPNRTSKRTEELLSYVESNLGNADMSLDLLSDKFGLCNRYISDIIKEKTGLSYKDYLTGLRIRMAQELLNSSELTVTAVCERVGYQHLPHFIKTFKRITGTTPSNQKASSSYKNGF